MKRKTNPVSQTPN